MAKKQPSKKGKTVWYKVLSPDGAACNGGSGIWSLPDDKGNPGKWMPKVANPKACYRGYHLIPAEGIPDWWEIGRVVCVAEGRGKNHPHGSRDGKVAFAEARILKVLGVPSRYWDDGRRMTGEEMVAHLINPAKAKAAYKARKKKEVAEQKAADAKLKAKEKAREAKRAKEKAAFLKKNAALSKAWNAAKKRGFYYSSFIMGWHAAKGVKLTPKLRNYLSNYLR